MLRRLAAATAALALTLGVAGTALAVIPGTLDQKHECAATDCNNTGDAAYPAWYSGNGTGNNDATAQATLAQTFTAGKTGPLTAVSLYLGGVDGAPPPASFTVGVTNLDGSGKPNFGSVLATGTVTVSDTTIGSSQTPAWVTVVFATPPTVTSGHAYAIVLGIATVTQSSAWMRWAVDSSESGAYTNYAGGEAMAATRPTSSSSWSWQTLISVFTDGGPGTADFGFRTYVGAAATASLPTQPPTDAMAPQSTSGGTGSLVLVGLLAAAAFAGLVVPSRISRRRRN